MGEPFAAAGGDGMTGDGVAGPGVRFNQRVFIAGPTESGKSELINCLFSDFRCQRMLVDTKGHEWTIAGVEPVSDPAAIDWREPIVHYVTSSTDVAEIDELFGRAERQRDLVVCVHELGDLCEYTTNKTPASVNRYLAQGGANGRGFIGASQLPVDMPKRARSEVQHIFTMVPAMDEEHLKVVCRMVERVSTREMRQQLEETERHLGAHSFIHWPKGARREPMHWPPLPDWMRSQSVIKRREAHAGNERTR